MLPSCKISFTSSPVISLHSILHFACLVKIRFSIFLFMPIFMGGIFGASSFHKKTLDMKNPITISIKKIILYFVQFLFIVLTHTNCKYALIHCIFANAKNGSRTYTGLQ